MRPTVRPLGTVVRTTEIAGVGMRVEWVGRTEYLTCSTCACSFFCTYSTKYE